MYGSPSLGSQLWRGFCVVQLLCFRLHLLNVLACLVLAPRLLGHLCIGKGSFNRKLKVSSLDLYLDKHGISCSKSTCNRTK